MGANLDSVLDPPWFARGFRVCQMLQLIIDVQPHIYAGAGVEVRCYQVDLIGRK